MQEEPQRTEHFKCDLQGNRDAFETKHFEQRTSFQNSCAEGNIPIRSLSLTQLVAMHKHRTVVRPCKHSLLSSCGAVLHTRRLRHYPSRLIQGHGKVCVCRGAADVMSVSFCSGRPHSVIVPEQLPRKQLRHHDSLIHKQTHKHLFSLCLFLTQ